MGKCYYCNIIINISALLLENPITSHFEKFPTPAVAGLEKELRGKHLKIGTLQNGVLSDAHWHNDTWYGTGAAFQVIELLQKMYGFQFSVVRENRLGSQEKGLLGLVYNEQVDLAAAFLPVTALYSEYTTFSTTLDMGEWVAIRKRPEKLASDTFGLLEPFSTNLWICILCSLIVVGFALFSLMRIFKRYCNTLAQRKSLIDCWWFVYGALLKQTTTLGLKTDSARVTIASWWIFATLITAIYTANLTTYLTISELPLSVSDIASKRYPLIIKTDSLIETLINNNLEELHVTYKNSRKVFVNSNDDDILTHCISNNQSHVYIAEQPNINRVLHQRIQTQQGCPFINLGSVYTSPRAFAYSRSFRFGSLFDKAIRNLVETGLVQHLTKMHLPDGDICPLNLRRVKRQLNNTHVALAYYILVGGFLLALIMFCAEISRKVLKQRQSRVFTKESKISLPPAHFMNMLLSPCLDYFPTVTKKFINGRYYWVTSCQGEVRLVPIRAASSLIFVKRMRSSV
ncbi:glutamate receptor ionotropic, delta-1-like [Photinus pyralis]|uniref:glutamate receptor ionotropic, delta-1-like n=1 Tax=Photinus pyralis TaxID=7054 RepID=UPI0012672927|nr:glutamate receptor ionotropic, delta-1-like [Photinus pyralis]